MNAHDLNFNSFKFKFESNDVLERCPIPSFSRKMNHILGKVHMPTASAVSLEMWNPQNVPSFTCRTCCHASKLQISREAQSISH
jgi:Zn ribbon nucleic-acid-binding protein